MSQDKQFYVYVHRYASGPKQGEVFYVGKGKGKRYKSNNGRSRYWENTANKYDFTAHIVARFHNEVCAFSFERALIAFYGKENLCNLTHGGEGTSGFVQSEETKKKMSISKKGTTPSDDAKMKMSASKKGPRHPTYDGTMYKFTHIRYGVDVCTKYVFHEKYGVDMGDVTGLVKGWKKFHDGWTITP